MKVSVPQYALGEGISARAAYDRIERVFGVKAKRGLKVDPEDINAKWAQVADARQGARNPSGVKKPAASKHAPPQEQRIASGMPNLGDAQRLKAVYEAQDKRLKVEERQGRLLERSEVVRLIGDMIVTAKTNLRGIGAKLAADIASETNAAACQAMIDAEVDEALSAISKWQPPSKPSAN